MIFCCPGCELAGVVVTFGGASGCVAVREEDTGRVIWEERTDTGAVENVWVGDRVILLVPGDFKLENSLSCVFVEE